MANDSAWSLGAEIANKNITARRDRKYALQDEQRQLRVSDLYAKGQTLAKLIPSLTGEKRDQAMNSLTDVEQNIAQIYHPDHNPGALQKDWSWLAGLVTGKITGHKPAAPALTSVNYDPTVIPDLTLTPETASGMSATEPLTLPGRTTGMSSGEPLTIPGRTVDVRPAASAMTKQQRQQMAQRDDARKRAALDVEAGGLSPEEQAQVDSRKNLAYINQARKDYKAANPSATPAQEAAFMSDLITKQYGITQRPVWKEYLGPNGEKDWLDITQPIPPGYTATGAENADTRKRADYAAFLKTNPDYESTGGNYERWRVEQGQQARLASPTSPDQRYIAIQQKLALGQPLTQDEQAYSAGYEKFVQTRLTAPGVLRAQASGAARPVQVQDEQHPGQVVYQTAGEAEKSGAATPQSILFKTQMAVEKYMTSGKGAENITFYNTAVSHLKILKLAADALANSDYQLWNKASNQWLTATGSPLATNFNAIKFAALGEVGKVFVGKSPTDTDQNALDQALNDTQSEGQLSGVINSYISLMGGKAEALHRQYDAAMKGQPAFGGEGGGAGGATTKTYLHTATNPQNRHKVGTDDDPNSPTAKWFDTVTGKPVQ